MSDQKTMRGAVAVPVPLLVAKDALGSTISAEIGGVHVDVTLPIPIRDKETPTPLKPPPGYEQFLDLPGRNDHSILGWGSVMGYEPSVWGVRVIAVSLSVAGEGAFWSALEWKQVKDAFGDWFDRVREWVCAARKIPLSLTSGDRYHFMHVSESGGSADEVAPETHHHERVVGVTRAEIEEAVRRVSRGEWLPLQHRLLLDAWSALVVGEFRRSTIDAATAAEVAIACVIREKLRAGGIADAVSSALIKDLNGIERILKLCRLLGGVGEEVSKNGVVNELAGARNDAAHNGTALTHDRASKAYARAQQVVDNTTPLAFP